MRSTAVKTIAAAQLRMLLLGGCSHFRTGACSNATTNASLHVEHYYVTAEHHAPLALTRNLPS